jgi:hypothetical protein
MRLPSAWTFFEQVIHDLRHDQRSVLIYLPQNLPPPRVWGQIQHHLADNKLCYVRCEPNIEPIKTFWSADSLPTDTAPTLENLFACEQASKRYYVQNIEQLPAESQETWTRFVNQWSQVSQQTSSSDDLLALSDDTPCLIMLVPAHLAHFHPDDNVRLAVYHWSGIPSLIETHLICRSLLNGSLSDTQHLWHEHLLPEIFSGDLGLLTFLWERAARPPTTNALLDSLREYGQQRAWDAVDITPYKTIPYQHNSSPTSLTQEQRNAWAQGWIYHSVEYGWEIHSALLALNDSKRDLEQRVWRGQARLLLPLIDQIRLKAIERFNDAYTEEWSAKWINPTRNEKIFEAVTNPYDVDWGMLRWLSRLETAPNAFKKPTFKRLADMAWQVRNRIAHFTPINLEDFERLTQVYQQWQMGG